MQLKLMEQQRTKQIAQIEAQKRLTKQRHSDLNGFDMSKLSLDDSEMFTQWLGWMRDNSANMTANEYARNLDMGKTFFAEAQDWYTNASSVMEETMKMSDGVYREKQNAKADGFMYDFTNEDYAMKQALYERPFSRNPNPPQGQFDPSRMGFVGPNGFQPITRGSRFDYNNLGPMIGEIEEYNTLTELYNSDKKSAKKYYDLLKSAKTEDVDFEFYNPSAVSAYHDTVWKFRNHRRSLLNQYETEQNALSSDAREIVLNENVFGKIDALKLASDAGVEQAVVDEINSVYDFGMEKTLEWGRQAWRPMRQSSSGSGSGSGGGSTKERLPKIDSSALVAQEFFRNVDQGNVVVALPLPIALDPKDFENIEKVGFMAFQSPKKIANTFEGLTDIQSAELRLRSFAMDSKYQLYTHVEVPRTKEVYTLVGEDAVFETLQDAQAFARKRHTTVNPQTEKKEVYEDEFIVVRPASLINAQGGFTADEWKTSPSMEDNFYRNVLMRIGREMNTALGVTQKGEEETMRDAWKYLVKEYGYE